MDGGDRDPAVWRDEQTALRTILEGTASETGEPFFMALVENLAWALGTHGRGSRSTCPRRDDSGRCHSGWERTGCRTTTLPSTGRPAGW
jgi:hypothetical protein